MPSGFRFTKDEITPNLKEMNPRLHAAVFGVMNYWADRAGGYARSNAPWTDRTGNARQGLNARAFESPDTFTIVVFHIMPYGIWLEVRWNGRYAIILPTIEHVGPEVMAMLRTVMARMG